MRSQLVPVILILFLAFGIRLYHLDHQSIWFDEGWSAYAAEQPTLLDAWNSDQTNPPLYYLLVNIAARGFGLSEFSLRYVSLLLGIVTVALAYRLGKTVHSPQKQADHRAHTTWSGLSSAIMVAFTPLLWWAAQEARMYTLLAVLVMIAALAWERLRVGKESRGIWVALWVAELALLYAHNTGPVIVLWLNATTLLYWISNRSIGRPNWRVWIAGQIGVGILYLPYFIGRFLLLPTANDAIRSTPPVSLDLLRQLWQSLWTGPWSMVDQETSIVWLSWAMLILILISIAWRRAGARWLVVHTLLLTSGLLLGLSVLGTDMHSRYLVMIVPLLLSAISFGGEATSNQILAIRRIALVALTCLMAINLATTNPRYQHDNARGMAQYYAETLGTGDTVLAWSYAERYELRYYWDRLGVQARLVTLPEGADMETILPLLPTSGMVARNVWFTQRADFRGMLGCLLGDGQENQPIYSSVFGMVNETYPEYLKRPITYTSPGATIGEVAQIISVGNLIPLRASQFQCVPIEIELLAPAPSDLSVQIYLAQEVDGQRIILSQMDTVFADARQRTTSMLRQGSRLQAFPLIKPPYGLPPGDYTIYLRIYDALQSSGYPIARRDGTPAVIDAPIGIWSAQAGAIWSEIEWRGQWPLEFNDSMRPLLASSAAILEEPETHLPVPARNGDFVIVELLWDTTDYAPLPLELVGQGWSLNIPVPDYPQMDDRLLDIRRFQIPLEAGAGEAELRLPSGQVGGRYQIENLPAIYEEPAVEYRVDAAFPQIGTLLGYQLPSAEADLSQPFAVHLVWRAETTSNISYTVFLQLIDDNGNVIAQSDMIPAGGTRPTTGWRSNEYIADEHLLQWNNRARSGSARLIVGLYDANTGERVRLMDGGDFIQLRPDIPVR